MSSPQRPGKTAPRLAQDIQDYDPAHPPGTGRNLLSEVPPVYPEHYNGPPDFISPNACRHHYVTKINQSLFLQPQQRSHGASSRVAAMCSKCRYHVQVVASYARGVNQHSQTLPGHIHHFVYRSGRQRGGGEEVTSKGQIAETFHYQCSFLTCPAAVSIRIVSPVLSPEFVQILTDPEQLRKRADEAIATHPERLEGIARPLPINVLENLRAYISNALYDSPRSKSISAVNKRFMICFGVDGIPCKDLLEFLEFSTKHEGFWEPPRPTGSAELPYQDELRVFLDDVVHELAALMEQRPISERKGHQSGHPVRPAFSDISYVLDAQDYPNPLRSADFQMAPAPYYEDLGAVEDMSSPLIVEAFNRQVSVDPARTPLYLKCLKSIGNLRGGEDEEIIDRAVQVAYAEGKYTYEDVIDAYKYFGLSHEDRNLTDDSIIGKFYAFLSSTNQENESRRQLWRIGDSRRSERIKAAAEERVSTAEQAQVFLGVDDKTSDDFIITMYTAKINDNPSSKDLARRAVELIAQSRKSDVLNHFLKTGEAGIGEMDIGDAYRLLQIPDRTVDDAAIMAAYTICVDEAPGQIDSYNRALSIIAKEKNSPLLSSMVGSTTQSERDLSEWPVGLQNIGNTCYLNSLLQFYFSIRPFRAMVLNFEEFRMDLDDESLSKKKVGSRKVSKKEVERSQKFLRELRTLFNNMITSPRPSVTPGQELARLTLISPTNEAAIRRRSTISANRAGSLGEINGMPIMGPLGPPQTIADKETREANDDAVATDVEKLEHAKSVSASDVDSEATLVSEGDRNDIPITQTDDKENEPPSCDEAMAEQLNDTATESGNVGSSEIPPAIGPVGPPNRPPPVPPRPAQQADHQRQLLEEVEIGAQQDVTEVINNVLFQSQCAVKPIGFESDGEQEDPIKDLFYGKTKSYISAEGNVRSKEERWSDIKVDVATGSRDIYSAIDGAFDVQKISVGNSVAEQFGSISKLPPILQIQVQRVQFDPVKKSSFKSTHHLELLETIYLDRYMDTEYPDLMNRRRQVWEWKNTLKMLETRREELLRKNESDGLDMPTLFDSAKGVLEDLNSIKEDPELAKDAIGIDSQTITELDQLSQMAKTELAGIEQGIEDTRAVISTQFADYKHLPYRLYAVFVHHGTVEFGHYYIYIYDFKKGIWRKYNDNEVSEVQDRDEIFKNYGRQNPPTPYFLIYINDTIKDRLVDPVFRQIVDTPPENEAPPPGDTPMVMEGVKTAEDMDMDPPSYDEVWTGIGPRGTRDDLTLARERKVAYAQGPEEPSSTSFPTVNPLKRKGVDDVMGY